MLVKNPSHRKALNSNQVRLLKVIFKFRFVSVLLLSEYLDKNKSTIYEQLLVLSSQNYISKSYNSSYRLPPRPATYALAAKGIKYLRDTTDLSQTALRNMYKNRTASDTLVVQSLRNLKLCLQLQTQYPGTFSIYTKSELTEYDKFLRPLPDLYLQRKNRQQNKPNGYLVEFIDSSTFSWMLRKRIQAHQDWCDEKHWKEYPHVLFLCGNDSTEHRIQRILENTFGDFEFYTTTTERLANETTKIWRQVFEEDDDGEWIYKGL